ncbi:hypothetical protein AB990_17610 [Alkalihalobacillus pseudalcaliphilus]|nr:GNAT family N-acetyltransferase [Alkalihalobacillus pseudalcaliphilus]KMK75384.1 hypothetical protein AB990_17610 [Alkalihalobacillus pseudalcaliphilus]
MEPINHSNHELVRDFFSEQWGDSKVIVSSGVYVYSELEGFIYKSKETIVGLITCVIRDIECEIISLNSLQEKRGIATKLISEVEERAIKRRCDRISIITTNDNLRALKFYQKRGYRINKVIPDAVNKAREIKPTIPLIGYNNIPLNDEIQLIKKLNLN